MDKKLILQLDSHTDAAGKFKPSAPRQGNEDSSLLLVSSEATPGYASFANGGAPDGTVTIGDGGVVMVVADGMGGMNAGEVASAIAIDVAAKTFESDQCTRAKDAVSRGRILEDIIRRADAAVKDDAGLCSALTNENIRVVFVLYGDICNISSIVRRIHEAGRFAVVHIDLIAGLAGKEVAVDFIRNTTEADGIISTRQSFIRRAKELGLAAILRVFLLDSIALESLDKIPANLPDCLDLLPGAMPKILRRVCAKAKVPVLTGGLIADKEDVMAALEAGATAISTTNQAVWDM